MQRLGNANDNIKLEWLGTPSAEDTVNPARFDQHQHRQVNFLDLAITIMYSERSADFAFKVYRKPGTAYAYLPYGSYHARHVFRGWLKAEMHRLLTHSSSPAVWLEECVVFYSHLRNTERLPVQGYRLDFSHSQLEPAQQNAGAKESCIRRSFLRSVPRQRLLEQKRAGKCGATGGDWTSRSRS